MPTGKCYHGGMPHSNEISSLLIHVFVSFLALLLFLRLLCFATLCCCSVCSCFAALLLLTCSVLQNFCAHWLCSSLTVSVCLSVRLFDSAKADALVMLDGLE